jgi:hypothetical protein
VVLWKSEFKSGFERHNSQRDKLASPSALLRLSFAPVSLAPVGRRLKDKLDHRKRKTCEQPGTPETTSCYANGTDNDVTDIQGKRESVNPVRRK